MKKIAILSNDSCYVNNIRSKCFKDGFEVDHLNSLVHLLNYLTSFKSGIVLLDIRRSSQIITFLYEKVLKNNILNFKFISLTDFDCEYIECDGIYSFSATASNVLDVINTINGINAQSVNRYIKEEVISESVISLLTKFCLPITMRGYDYLIEGIKYRINNIDGKLSVKNDLLPYLSNKFNESVVNIEKCVRMAVNHMDNTRSRGYSEFFSDLHVTVKVFVEMVARDVIKCS